MFEVGRVYHRRNEIHGIYGGQAQGGMSTPREHPFIFLFAGESGIEHGYRDEVKPDGTYWYTGEGQKGEQTFTKCNKALRDHHELGKNVYLFEEAGSGLARYLGEVEYLDYHFEERLDTEGNSRKAIIFELGFIDFTEQTMTMEEPIETTLRQLKKKSLAELRNLALSGAVPGATAKVRKQTVYLRSKAVREYVLKRSDGICEGCQSVAPFLTKKGEPYLEPHHTTRVADGGPDHPAHVIALCPTCHRRVHYAEDCYSYNAELIAWLKKREGTA